MIPLDWTAWTQFGHSQTLWKSRRKEPGKLLFTSGEGFILSHVEADALAELQNALCTTALFQDCMCQRIYF